MIVHCVHFGYKASVTSQEKDDVAQRFLKLKEECLSKSGSKEPYIISLVGGSNNSPEGMSHGLHHSFVVTFANIQDRDYYLDYDPAHQAFKDNLAGKLETATVMDFDEGVFA